MHTLRTGPVDAVATLVLAHGAGAPMDSPWMDSIAARLGERGIRVVRFEFAYMAARRSGTRKPPPRAETLLDEYRTAVDAVDERPLFVGGKSLGGRVASLVADELWDAGRIAGLACLSYPFHPPGRPEQLRTAHLEGLRAPTLICQGERDPFGGPDEVAGYRLSPAIRVQWFEDGDHDLRPRKGVTGRTLGNHLAAAADAVRAFVSSSGGA